MVAAVAAVTYGPAPEVVDLVEVDSRAPGPGEVRVIVRAAPVNPFDAKIAAGAIGTDPAKLPRRLGSEAAGIVAEVGPHPVGLEGAPLRLGDAVFGTGLSGAQAAELTVAAASLIRKPDSLSFEEASGLLVVGTTAFHALEAASVSEGDTVLVHGAAGSVGTMIAQLARLRGASVIGTASPRRHAELEALGVTPVAYGAGLSERVGALGGATAAIDTAGTEEALAVSLEFVDPARVVTIANANFEAALAAGAQAIGGGAGADPGTEIRAAARLTLTELAATGRITVPIAETFPLSEARAAYALVVDGHAGGKVVLIP